MARGGGRGDKGGGQMAFLDNLVRDLRFSVRSLARSPGFTAVAVLSLALGIGAGTAVFSLVNAILLRALPVPNPEELRVLQWSGTDVHMRSYDGSAWVEDGNRWSDAEAVSPPAFLALRAHGAPEADVFGFYPVPDAAVAADGRAFVASGLMVSDNFFSALQVRPSIGRLLEPGEDYGGGDGVVVAYDCWQRQFGGDPGVLGRTVALNGTAFTVVGVLAPGFSGVQPGEPTDFYVPLSAGSPFLYTSIEADWHWFVRMMARLHPGLSDARLAAALDVGFAGQTGTVLKNAKVQVEAGTGGLAYDREQYGKPLQLILAVVGLVLVAACANLAGLLLARGADRRHEVAVRAALGGGRWRLFQQALTDSLTIALLGGGLGVVLASWGRSTLASLLAGDASGLRYDFSLDHRVLAFSLAITLAAAVMAGLLPSLGASRANPVAAFRSRGAIAPARARVGHLLVVGQICLALLVLTSAGLFARTLANLTRVDVGFPLERLLLVGLNIRGGVGADADPAGFYDRLEASVATIPGVRHAAVVEFPLLSPGGHSGTLAGFVNGPSAAEEMQVSRLRVGEAFFATMGIPIVSGRGPTASDAGDAPKVVVVNESFVRRLVAGRDPIGLAFRMWDAEWRIVGVCGDAKYTNLKEPAPPTAYFPYRQMFYSRFRGTHLRHAYVALRTALPPLAVAADVRRAVARIDPGVAVTAVTTEEQVRDRAIARERLVATLCGGLAGLALLLSWVGLFGLMAYGVARRTPEIGIRMALGASRVNITGPIVRDALLLTTAGIAVGLPLSFVLGRLFRSRLFGVTPGDPWSTLAAVAALLLTAAGAAWIPARRAQRVEPTEALRCDA
jgi:predicted permease